MSQTLLIKNGHLIDPDSGIDAPRDLLIRDGKVAEVASKIVEPDPAAQVIDATGLIVTPGWVDIHTHLREPGFTHKETIYTGTRAAAAGGFTTIACMANTKPVNDSAFITTYLYQKIASEAVTNVHVIGAISKGLNGEELAEIGSMWEAGAVGISDDGKTVMNSYLMRKAMDYSKRFDLVVISHAEDACLKGKGVMNEGHNSAKFGLRGNPAAAEEIIVARDIQLAELTGAKLHIAHVSTRGSVELLRQAKKRGVQVTGEATPHHLSLSVDVVGNYDTNTKVAPPLRTQEDVDCLREAVCDGTIDTLATDHAPHSALEKEVEYDDAEFGMVGLETAFPFYYNLVHRNGASLKRIVEAMTVRPADIIGVPRGRLRPGMEGDVTIFDPKAVWTIDRTAFRSKSQNTPFQGWKVTGRVAYTIVGGRVVYNHVDGILPRAGGNAR